MKKIIIALSIALSFAIPTAAFADQAACEAKAVSKEDGKPLYGATKAARLKSVKAVSKITQSNFSLPHEKASHARLFLYLFNFAFT
ncbi:hypothetical protein [Polynucleobacter necessarius]|uniref:hypothetical protein n=1 Tax=Polynucleobacter necessarius TaxID=576610 RepID=UPI0013B05301|nr:hypothetical protein [Polynucleobacter necessarius]